MSSVILTIWHPKTNTT